MHTGKFWTHRFASHFSHSELNFLRWIGLNTCESASHLCSLVPSPPLPLTKWPRKGWSGIFGPISWFSPSQIILANQILTNQIAVWSREHPKTRAKLVGTSITCKRSGMKVIRHAGVDSRVIILDDQAR